ncbi:hypothetical protein IMY05_009G0010200 [Salix suchowensis]|nr:hypothetical protein IMY05_009G0010200 [Salix suchowensis]
MLNKWLRAQVAKAHWSVLRTKSKSLTRQQMNFFFPVLLAGFLCFSDSKRQPTRSCEVLNPIPRAKRVWG